MKNFVFVVALFLGVVACTGTDASDSQEATSSEVSVKTAVTVNNFTVTEPVAGANGPVQIMWGTDPAWAFADHVRTMVRARLNFLPSGCTFDKVRVHYQRNGAYTPMKFTIYNLTDLTILGQHTSSSYPIWQDVTEDVIINKQIGDSTDYYLYVEGDTSLHLLFDAAAYYSC